MNDVELLEQALRRTTVFTSTEPCALCAAAVHWSGIGAVESARRVHGGCRTGTACT